MFQPTNKIHKTECVLKSNDYIQTFKYSYNICSLTIEFMISLNDKSPIVQALHNTNKKNATKVRILSSSQ